MAAAMQPMTLSQAAAGWPERDKALPSELPEGLQQQLDKLRGLFTKQAKTLEGLRLVHLVPTLHPSDATVAGLMAAHPADTRGPCQPS